MRHITMDGQTFWCEMPAAGAVATVEPGEIFTVDSTSFTHGYDVDTIDQLSSESIVAPVTGPIRIVGAMPGDCLAIDIVDLKILRDFGCALLLPGPRQVLTDLGRPMAFGVPLDDEYVYMPGSIRLPLKKMLGKVCVAPPERVRCNVPGVHGGNMDNNDITIGSRVYLPVFVEGAYLSVGDAHARQADGECGASAVEVEMRSTLRVTVIKDWPIAGPIIRTDSHVMTMGHGADLDEAALAAQRAMLGLLTTRLDTDDRTAARIMGVSCDLHIAQLANALVSVKARVPRSLLDVP